jgi:hypothetical protein
MVLLSGAGRFVYIGTAAFFVAAFDNNSLSTKTPNILMIMLLIVAFHGGRDDIPDSRARGRGRPRPRARWLQVESSSRSRLVEHDLFGNPVSTFLDHALGPDCAAHGLSRLIGRIRQAARSFAMACFSRSGLLPPGRILKIDSPNTAR